MRSSDRSVLDEAYPDQGREDRIPGREFPGHPGPIVYIADCAMPPFDLGGDVSFVGSVGGLIYWRWFEGAHRWN